MGYRPWQFWLICQITVTCLKTWTHLAMILCQCDLDIPICIWYSMSHWNADFEGDFPWPNSFRGAKHRDFGWFKSGSRIWWFFRTPTIALNQGIMFASSHLKKKKMVRDPHVPAANRILVFSVPWSSIHRDWYSHKDSLSGHMNVGPPFMIAKLVQITSITIVYDTYNYS